MKFFDNWYWLMMIVFVLHMQKCAIEEGAKDITRAIQNQPRCK